MPRHHRLIHPRTLADARLAVASRRCGILAYTSVVTNGPHPQLFPPPQSGGCVFVFVGEETTREEAPPWTYLVHRRTNYTLTMSARRFSKIPKLNPHVFAGNAIATVFFDSKLHMNASLPTLGRLFAAHHRPFVACRHPSLGRDALDWMQREAHDVIKSRRVDNAKNLKAQVARYMAMAAKGQIPTHCRTYIDGALLMQRNASALFTAWSEEMFLPTSSDRDQIAFAFVVGSTCVSVGTIGPKGQRLLGDGRSYRHWYRDGSIALLHRTDFERKPPTAPRAVCPAGSISGSHGIAACCPAAYGHRSTPCSPPPRPHSSWVPLPHLL